MMGKRGGDLIQGEEVGGCKSKTVYSWSQVLDGTSLNFLNYVDKINIESMRAWGYFASAAFVHG